MKKYFQRLYKKVKEYCVAYPAVLSGFFIYSYLLYCVIHYFYKVRSLSISFYDIIDSFDALPFMWLLSVALVKIIDIRTKLYQSEEQRLKAEREAELIQVQLQTLQEVSRGLQHHINNPLAVVKLAIEPARREARDNGKLQKQLDIVEESVNKISSALEEFTKAREYVVKSMGPIVGDIPQTSGGENNGVD